MMTVNLIMIVVVTILIVVCSCKVCKYFMKTKTIETFQNQHIIENDTTRRMEIMQDFLKKIKKDVDRLKTEIEEFTTNPDLVNTMSSTLKIQETETDERMNEFNDIKTSRKKHNQGHVDEEQSNVSTYKNIDNETESKDIVDEHLHDDNDDHDDNDHNDNDHNDAATDDDNDDHDNDDDDDHKEIKNQGQRILENTIEKFTNNVGKNISKKHKAYNIEGVCNGSTANCFHY